MATTIKLKNGSGAPTAGDLVQGEPAIDLTNKRLYTEDSGGSVIEVGSNPSSLSIAGTAVTATATELNILDGVTSTTAELNILDGVTSTAAELNILDGVTASTAELNLLDGVTATTSEFNILDGVTATATEINILDGVTSTTAELNILDGVTATATELNILDGKSFLDEDDMVSDSATGIPSQQSVKAYVDAQVTASGLDFQGDSGGALSIDLVSETLTIAGGTGIDTSGATNTLTVAIDSTVATLTGTQTLTNKTLTSAVLNTGVSGTAVLDEDDMSSDSATQLATQQSIKAYVDSQVAGADTLSELTDTNITTPADGALLFYDTTTSKWIDNVVSGDVTIADTGVAAIGSGVIVNDDINASAAISVSKTALTAGTGLTLTSDTLSVDASQTQITAVGTIGTGTWQGSVISDTYVANDLTISGGTIENTVIGASTPAAGTFTTFTSNGIDDNADAIAITIDSSENVGIGGSPVSSTRRLMVKDSGDVRVDIRSGADTNLGAIDFSDTSNTARGQLVYDHNDDSMQLKTLSTERMRIDSSGNVGIGTTSPATVGSYKTLHIQSGHADAGGYIRLASNTSGEHVDIFNFNTSFYVDADTHIFRSVNDTEYMRINSSGNVGIGTTSPTNTLVVSDGNDGLEFRTSLTDDNRILSYNRNTSAYTKMSLDAADYDVRVAGTVKATIDSSGNVGIGTTSTSGIQGNLHIHSSSNDNGDGDGQVNFGDESTVIISTNATSAGAQGYYGSLFFGGQDVASGTQQVWKLAGISAYSDLDIGTTGSADLLFHTTNAGSTPSERMRIDSSGNVGIGVTSMVNKLTVNGDQVLLANGELKFADAGNSLVSTIKNQGASGTSMLAFLTGSTPSERMRVTQTGDVLIGKTATNYANDGFELRGGGDGRLYITNTTDACTVFRRNGSNGIIQYFYRSSSNVGNISVTTTATSYNTSSDQRLKENIVDASAGNIDAIQVRSFDWKADGTHQPHGMIAQELVDVAPEAVTQGEADDDMWQVDYSKLVPMMIKEIQDLRARVAQLEGA